MPPTRWRSGALPMRSHRVASYSPVKQRSLLRSRRALLRPGSLSSLSLLFVGWIERQQHPSPALAGPVRWVSRTALNPSREFVSFVSSFPRHSCPGSLSFPSFSASDPRPRGWRSAGRRYPLSCRARNRATPRLRSVGRPAQPERRLAALHRDGFGPQSPLCDCGVASAASVGSRTSRQRIYKPPQDATSRSAFRKRF